MTGEEAIAEVFSALKRAEELHPGWPMDPIHAAGIVAEEAGELVQAAIDMVYSNRQPKDMALEAAQVAAMGIRFLLAMNMYSSLPSIQVQLDRVTE